MSFQYLMVECAQESLDVFLYSMKRRPYIHITTPGSPATHFMGFGHKSEIATMRIFARSNGFRFFLIPEDDLKNNFLLAGQFKVEAHLLDASTLDFAPSPILS